MHHWKLDTYREKLMDWVASLSMRFRLDKTSIVFDITLID